VVVARAHLHDPAAGLFEGREQQAAEEHRMQKVGRQDDLGAVGGELPATGHPPVVVHQARQSPSGQPPPDQIRHPGHAGLIREVAGDEATGQAAAGEVFFQGPALGRIPADEPGLETGGGQLPGDLASDPGGSAGDEHNGQGGTGRHPPKIQAEHRNA